MTNLEKIADSQLHEIAIEYRRRVAALQAINAADFPADTGNEEVEVSEEMVAEWQTFLGSPADEALTETEAVTLLRRVTEVELLAFPSL